MECLFSNTFKMIAVFYEEYELKFTGRVLLIWAMEILGSVDMLI